jgi:hypothetical protein
VSPSHAAGQVDVQVTAAGGTSAIVAADHYTFVATPAPVVSSISPTSGPGGGGTSVTITGSGFTGATSVKFGTVAVASFMVNPAGTSITVTSPAHIAGTFDVTVTTPGGTSATSAADQFTYAAPTVVHYYVLFGTQKYDLIGSTRIRLPWSITGIQVVFSEPITAGDASSLTGLPISGVSGVGTSTLTWTLSAAQPIGSFMTNLIGGGTALMDAGGNGLTGTTAFNFKVLQGDVNDDGYVNSQDFLLAYAATAQPYNIFFDVNGDGVVDMTDVMIVRNRIGTQLP